MAEIVVADASPFIALARIDQLALLPRIFSRAILPLAVYLETQSRPELPDASAIRAAREKAVFLVHEGAIRVVAGLPGELGGGEAAAISLALQMRPPRAPQRRSVPVRRRPGLIEAQPQTAL